MREKREFRNVVLLASDPKAVDHFVSCHFVLQHCLES